MRRRILAAAAEEFAVRGFAAAKLTEIARRAGFTKGAVYSNFESKQDLFAELFAERSLELAGRVLAEIADLDIADAVGRGGETISTWLVGEPGWALLVLEFGVQAAREPAIAEAYLRERRSLRSQLEDLIAGRADAWGIADRVDAHVLAITIMALISGLMLEHAVDPEQVDQQAVQAAVAGVFAGAFARP
ncbi:TetR/AcrR family transcriptional regulator [Rhodococcus sp. Q]|uniref:TetR/AcrR family transcriptional regulator n=1 Tax=Rhodococcus sp. Q TaxID=2502252 RepID=UPI002015E8F4|nr:TetR/AcrR family transcriptional regulator [Rhodococcus sp. Q]